MQLLDAANGCLVQKPSRRPDYRYMLTKAPGMNCQDPVLFRAKGGRTTGTDSGSWSFIYFVNLPDGIYRAQARAFDNAGNKERPARGRNIGSSSAALLEPLARRSRVRRRASTAMGGSEPGIAGPTHVAQ